MWNLIFFQYYEMSYGLNVEMHKQVSEIFLIYLKIYNVINIKSVNA